MIIHQARRRMASRQGRRVRETVSLPQSQRIGSRTARPLRQLQAEASTTFTKNVDHLLDHDVSKLFFQAVLARGRGASPALRPALHGGRDAAGVLDLAEEPGAEAEPGWAAEAPRVRPEVAATPR